MTKGERNISISFRLCIRAFAAVIPMPASTGWRACWNAGEDPLYVARRLVRMALEDIGLADPLAVVEAIAAQQSYQFLGSPEGDLALAQAVVYLALAPKSNAVYTAFGKALEVARKTGSRSRSHAPSQRPDAAPERAWLRQGLSLSS